MKDLEEIREKNIVLEKKGEKDSKKFIAYRITEN